MRWLRSLGILCIVLALCLSTMLVLGTRLPRTHVTMASVVVAAPQERVWATMEDLGSQTEWRPEVRTVEALASQGGHRCWVEVQRRMRLPLCEEVTLAPATRVVRIEDPELPFGGTWTYDLQPVDTQQTRLTITERGTIGPVLWRFFGHYVFGEDTTIRRYETEMQRAVANGRVAGEQSAKTALE